MGQITSVTRYFYLSLHHVTARCDAQPAGDPIYILPGVAIRHHAFRP
jgi:hypothetical protein